jgi:tripartite-type tricarboxylate transporter receptor subunit TctC
MKRNGWMMGVLFGCVVLIVVGTAWSQQEKYPDRPIKVIIGSGAGGSLDTHARLIAPYVEKYLGATLVLENMEGAAGRKARGFVYRAKPDGYTIMAANLPSMAIGELLYQGDYKTTQFSCIHGIIGDDYYIVAVAPNQSSIKSFKELVEESKKKPVKISTAGMGSGDHLIAVLIKRITGIQYDLVPFNGAAEQIAAALGGKVPTLIDTVSLAGARPDLRTILVTAPKRAMMRPDVPTLAEEGYPNLDISYSVFFMAPPGLPEEKRKLLEDAVAKAIAEPEYQAKVKKTNGIPLPMRGVELKKMAEDIFKRTQEALPLLEADIKK